MCDNQEIDEHFHITANCLDMQKLPKAAVTKEFHQCVNVAKRYESPNIFYGYGSEKGCHNPIYRTSNSEYGWYMPSVYTVPHRYFPQNHSFSEHLFKCGMYRNYSLNTTLH